jgi:CubicO group peptidase (beta-lactamase class C family)
VIEVVEGKPLAVVLQERLFAPLKMADTAFVVPQGKWGRIAEPLQKNPLTGQPNDTMLDVKLKPLNDSGGGGAVSTASDYLRFAEMMRAGGKLDGRRYLSPTTVKLMASDHLGPRPSVPVTPGELLMGAQGYTFGLGFMVRQGAGMAAVPGSEGEFMWAGAGGTFFWIDPKEQLVAVYMAQTPGAIRPVYRRLIKTLVYQAIDG